MKTRIRTSVVCIHDSKLLVFKGVDPTSKRVYRFLPGGKIEAGETPWACGQRETVEETGYRVQVHADSEIVATYQHWWDGKLYDCKTYFYAAELDEPWHEPGPIEDADYNEGPEWMPISQIRETFGYCPEIFDAVERLTAISR